MLLPYTSLTYYGPGATAMTTAESAATIVLAIKGTARAAVANGGSGVAALLKATRLVNSPIFAEGVGVMVAATPKGRGRPTLTVNIGAVPSAFDIAQTVLNAMGSSYNIPGTIGAKINDAGSASNPWTEVIESGLSAAEVMRLILSFAANNAEGLEGPNPVFKSRDGTKARITATYNAGTRTVTGIDGT